MADFNVNLSPPQGAGARPIQPVQEQVVPFSPNPLLEGVVNIFSKGLIQDRKDDAAARRKAVVDEYTRSEQTYIDALTSGQWTAAQAATASRANYTKMIGSYSEYADAIDEQRKRFVEGTEAGRALKIEDTAAKERAANKERAAQRGYVFYDGMSQEAEDKLIESSQAAIRSERDIEAAYKANGEKRAQIASDLSIDADQRARQSHQLTVQEHLDKENAARQLVSIAGKNIDAVDSVAKDLIGKNMPYDQKLMLYKQQTQGLKDAMTAAAVRDPGRATPFIKLLEDREDIFKQMADPKAKSQQEKDALQNQFDSLVLKTKLMLLSDDKTRGAVGLSQLFGNSDAVMQLGFSPVISGNLAKLGLGPDAATEKPQVVGTMDEKQTLKALQKTIGQFQAGKVSGDPAKQALEASGAINEILRQTGSMQGSIPATQLKELASFYSSPEFGKAVEQGLASKETMQNAKRVFQVSYEPAVVNAIQRKLFTESGSPVMIEYSPGRDGGAARSRKDVSILSTLDIRFSGSGVVFATRPGTDDTFGSESIRKDLKEAEAGLNTLIKVGAHMEGTTNYAKYWEDNKHLLMPRVYPDPAKLKPGQVVNGYKYIGGAYSDRSNWQRVQEPK